MNTNGPRYPNVNENGYFVNSSGEMGGLGGPNNRSYVNRVLGPQGPNLRNNNFKTLGGPSGPPPNNNYYINRNGDRVGLGGPGMLRSNNNNNGEKQLNRLLGPRGPNLRNNNFRSMGGPSGPPPSLNGEKGGKRSCRNKRSTRRNKRSTRRN